MVVHEGYVHGRQKVLRYEAASLWKPQPFDPQLVEAVGAQQQQQAALALLWAGGPSWLLWGGLLAVLAAPAAAAILTLRRWGNLGAPTAPAYKAVATE